MPITLPTIEPLPPSRIDRLNGREPSLWARLIHVTRQLVPNGRFILKWTSIGAFAITAVTGIVLLMAPGFLEIADKDARKKARAEIERFEREKKATIERAAEAEEFEALNQRAKGNWETWKGQFTSDADGIACAYGHIYNNKQKLFEISCQIGPKGHLPTTLVVCNQDICRVMPPTPTPTPEVKK